MCYKGSSGIARQLHCRRIPYILGCAVGIYILWRCMKHTVSTQNRITARGSLLFMRCVFLTFTWLVSAWLRREVPSAILAKPLLSDCVTVFCLRQCKSRHLKFVKFWNNTCYFQTNWKSFILNWSVRFDVVSDAGRTCCCCSFLLLTVPPSDWRTSLKTKLEVSVRQQI